MDRGAWWAAVHGIAKGQTWLSGFNVTFHFYALEKEMATHSSVLGLENPMDGEPGGLQATGSQRVGHDWSDLASCAMQGLQSLLWHEEPLSRGVQTLSCDMLHLVSWPGIEPGSPELGVQRLSHWTTRAVLIWNFSLERWEKILEMDDGDDWTTVWMYFLMPLNRTLKMVKF